MTLETLSAFFGWLTILHLCFFAIAAGLLIVLQDWITGLHARMFNLTPQQIKPIIYRWLGSYKILILTTALGPWLALQLV